MTIKKGKLTAEALNAEFAKKADRTEVAQALATISGTGSGSRSQSADDITAGTLNADRYADTLSQAIDKTVGGGQNGDILVKRNGAWTRLGTGNQGQVLQARANGDLAWVNVSLGGGTSGDSAPVNTAAPTITPGTAREGTALTCNPGSWTGSPFPTFGFQWFWADTGQKIVGATAQTYTPVTADVGHTLRCDVTATNSVKATTASSVWTSAVLSIVQTSAPTPLSPATVSGNAAIGGLLTADPGAWGGAPAPTFAYQWQWADTGANIIGATSKTYSPVAADYGHTLRARVTASNGIGAPVQVFSAATAAIPGIAPTNKTAPSISPTSATGGTAGQGTQLTCNPGVFDGVPAPQVSFQWFYGDTAQDIAGATGSVYVAKDTDTGHYLGCRVKATNAAGNVSVNSNLVPVAASQTAIAPSASSAPTITGVAQEGSPLTATGGAWSGSPTPSLAYQWYRADSNAPISGATSASYTPTSADVGHPLKVVVTASNTAGTATASSVQTALVTAAPVNNNIIAPQPIAAPVLSGSTARGSKLTVTPGTYNETPIVLPSNNVLPAIVGNPTVGQTLSIATPVIDPANLAGTADKTFEDEFNTLSLWDGTSGTWNTTSYWDTPGGYSLFSNSEAEWYVDSRNPPPISVTPWAAQSGILTLTASVTASGNLSYANQQPYVSGQLNTYHSFSQLYGYFEARLQFPRGKGLWPAFWLLQNDRAWPPEIDIVEFINDATTTWYGATHSGTDTPKDQAVTVSGSVDVTAGFHTYAVNWSPTKLEWYFDGVKVGETPPISDFTKPAFILLNLAVGGAGSWPGAPDVNTVFPAAYKCDWVRVWKAKPAWSNADSLAYQWTRDGANIPGATNPTYTLVAADATHQIGVKVTGINAGGQTVVTSAAVGPVTSPAIAAKWSATDKSGGVTLSNNNLTATSTGNSDAGVRATSGYSITTETARRSFTLTYTASGGSFFFGMVKSSFDLNARDNTGAGGAFFGQYQGLHGPGGSQPSGMWSTLAVNDVVTIAMEGGIMKVSKNGGTEYSLDVSAYGEALYPLWMGANTGDSATADFSNW